MQPDFIATPARLQLQVAVDIVGEADNRRRVAALLLDERRDHELGTATDQFGHLMEGRWW